MSDEHDIMKSDRSRHRCFGSIMRSFDLLGLQLDRLLVHEYPLPLVRLRLPPPPDARSERIYHLFIDPLQQYSRRQRRASLHTHWYAQFNGMGVSYFQRHKVLAWILLFDCDGRRLYRCSVADTDESEDGSMTFRDAKYVVLEV